MTLTEFLLARITEDERDGWEVHVQGCPSVRDTPFPCECNYPARVLAECEVKRRIVELHQGSHSCSDGDEPHAYWPFPGAVGGNGRDLLECPTVRALALPYADHPEFQKAWRV